MFFFVFRRYERKCHFYTRSQSYNAYTIRIITIYHITHIYYCIYAFLWCYEIIPTDTQQTKTKTNSMTKINFTMLGAVCNKTI